MSDRAQIYYRDLIVPEAIEHVCEFGVSDDAGGFDYYYNWLDYRFIEAGRTIRARHYLSDRDTALVYCDMRDVDDFTLRVLVFLLMRYQNLSWLTETGYEPMPESVAAQVRTRLDDHMADRGGDTSA